MTPARYVLDADVKRITLWVSFILLVCSVTTAFVTARVQLDAKVDKADFDAVGRKVDALLIFACRVPENVKDTNCSGVKQ